MKTNKSKNIVATKIVSKTKKRVGRGISSGQGKTAGRGTKGQRSRSGFNLPKRFEGGQTPLSMRLPKLRGFKVKKRNTVLVNLDMISQVYKDGETVSVDTLLKKGVIKKKQSVKILNNKNLTKNLILSDVPASRAAAKHFVAKAKVAIKKTTTKVKLAK